MKQAECVAFLQWCLPRLRMRWRGFRKVRSQVCKRIGRRLRDLGLGDHAAYRLYLESHGDEWAHLDALCRITVSRFNRDHGVFEALTSQVLPAVATTVVERGDRVLRAWSCGCACGEEAYTLAIAWATLLAPANPGMEMEIIATDADPLLLDRARRGEYTASSLRELPENLRRAAMQPAGKRFRVRDPFRQHLSWLCQDVRGETPAGPFDLILCRNLVLTYFDETLQREVMDRVVAALRPGGALVVGSHENLPPLTLECEPWQANLPVYRRLG